jgi:hypothetical protein
VVVTVRLVPALLNAGTVIIYAADKFCCRHRYIATVEHERLLFVCDQCDHRTELLCLDRPAQPSRVVSFAPADADLDGDRVPEQYSA